ncbi:hypothetical protein JTB14_023103 [Gonioctena quinquepunctata]|nr:hypothetical protein JTB14_023103 [Gonioctena quinquepunctata]
MLPTGLKGNLAKYTNVYIRSRCSVTYNIEQPPFFRPIKSKGLDWKRYRPPTDKEKIDNVLQKLDIENKSDLELSECDDQLKFRVIRKLHEQRVNEESMEESNTEEPKKQEQKEEKNMEAQ